MREDFEIYEFIRDGKQWYGFKVEYFGIYAAPTKELILAKRREIKKAVKAKLAWVERENQKYYKRLAEETRQRLSLLHEAKEQEKQMYALCDDIVDKKARTQIVYNMMKLGMSNEDILLSTDIPHRVVSRLRHEFENKKTQHGERM